MKKKQVRKRKPSIYYKTEMVKKASKILWRAVEMPSKVVLKESFFEDDVKSIVKSIPGGDFLLGLFEDDTLAEQIADKEAEVAKIQKDVDSDGIFETRANREKNERELLEAQRELEELRAQQRNAGGTTIVNNYNSTASSNSTTVTTQSLQDAAVATGSTMN